MKAILFGTAIIVATFLACNNASDQSKEIGTTSDTSKITKEARNKGESLTPGNEIVVSYLKLKNALVSDNATDAATAGKALSLALENLDSASLMTEQNEVFIDVKDDMKEHAEHIAGNADKIAHQREHFEVLSKDMYELVKAFKPSQALYWDHCPMYNDNKGANWLSEVKEIKNPYLGKKMPTCGSVKEEIE